MGASDEAARNPVSPSIGAACRSLFDHSGEMVCILDLDGRFVSVNPAGEQLTGYPAADLIGRFALELIVPEEREQAARAFNARLRDETSVEATTVLTRAGAPVPVHVTSTVISSDGSPTGVLGIVSDRSGEARSRLADARFRTFFESAPVGLAIFALDGSFSDANAALCGIVGYTKPELRALTFRDITHPDDLEASTEFLHAILAREIDTYQIEKRYIHKLGHPVWVLVSVSLAISSSGEPEYFIDQIQDITERKLAESRLSEAEQQYRTLVEQMPIGMYIRSMDMALPNIYASPQVESMLGYPAEQWETDPGMLALAGHPDDRERILAGCATVRAAGEPLLEEYRYVAADGRVVWVQDRSYRVPHEVDGHRIQGFLLDITARKRVEEERDQLRETLHEAQKLEALGRFAGGVAHDFNNMLTAIKGYSELLLDRLEPGSTAHHEAEQIHRAAEQASSLPAQLLAFASEQTMDVELVDLSALVLDASSMLRHIVGATVDVTVTPAVGPALVRVDPDRIEQTLVNLALNARDAMPDGGTLTITVSSTEFAADREHAGGQAGSYVMITVADEGHGMDPETRARAMEPFFTTKSRGKGSGLGLASVYGTVSQSGGFVSLESAPGRGTTVELCFPAATGEVSGDETSTPARVVLLVEDEDLVRELVTSVLEREGFTVLAADRGREALEMLARLNGPIELLITDLVMPGMSGQDLSARVAETHPEARVVFISGYSERLPTAAEARDGGFAFVAKPFSTAELVQAVNNVLPRRLDGDNATEVRVDTITCVVADDHPTVLDSVSRYLERTGFEITARVLRADDAVKEIEARRPATALVDITMEPFSGIEVVRRASAASPETAFVLYTGHRDHGLLREALDAGARGFVLKNTALSELVDALRTVAGGGTYVDAELAAALTSAATSGTLPSLTKRERQVLTLLSGGLTNDRVAAELGISSETVQSHVRNTMAKLDADTRTQAVATAIRQALIN